MDGVLDLSHAEIEAPSPARRDGALAPVQLQVARSSRSLTGSRGSLRLALDDHGPTPLPCAEPATRPLPRSGHDHVSCVLPAPLVEKLCVRAVCARADLDTVSAAAWAIVLSRYTRRSTIVFGRVGASADGGCGGARGEAPRGICPMHVDVDEDRSVNASLAEIAGRYRARLVREHAAPDGSHQGATSFALSLIVSERGETLELRLAFERRRFRDEAIARMMRSLCFVFEQLADERTRFVREVETLPAQARDAILRGWNDTACAGPDTELIHEQFEARATERPDAIAIEVQGLGICYAEVERRANRLAHALRQRGARPGTFVGVCVDRGAPLIVSLLAVAKSGAACVPLDPHVGQTSLASMMSAANVELVIAQARHHQLFPSDRVLDPHGAAVDAMPSYRPERLAAGSDACYASFSSGRGGEPSAAVLSHRAVTNTLAWMNRTFEVRSNDRSLFVTSPELNLCLYDVFGILGAGGTVVIAKASQLADPTELVRVLLSEAISIWCSPPATWQSVAAHIGQPPKRAALRLVLLSGDRIPLALPASVRRFFPTARVIGLGGGAEVAICSHWYPIAGIDPSWSRIPYGRPIGNARAYVLDERMRPVPIGVVGNLYIGGACLADGYLNQAELTRERFVQNPVDPRGTERLHRTGDLARFLPNGNLDLVGRADAQIEVGGRSVDLAEVESILRELRDIDQALCLAHLDARGRQSLVAYVVAGRGHDLEPRALRSALETVLPGYMVPDQVLLLPCVPLSRSGTIDRRRLPPPVRDTASEPQTLAHGHGAPEQTSHRVHSYHPDGRRLPLVLVAGERYPSLSHELATLFDQDQPIHFVEVCDLHSRAADAVLTECEAEILSVCPPGALVVGGVGAQAFSALALARRLEKHGRSVPLLVIFDASKIATPPPEREMPSGLMSHAGRRLRAMIPRQRSAHASSQRPAALRTELLMIRTTDTLDPTVYSARPSPSEFRALVSGRMCVMDIAAEHLGSLSDSSQARVIEAITERIDRLSVLAAG